DDLEGVTVDPAHRAAVLERVDQPRPGVLVLSFLRRFQALDHAVPVPRFVAGVQDLGHAHDSGGRVDPTLAAAGKHRVKNAPAPRSRTRSPRVSTATPSRSPRSPRTDTAHPPCRSRQMATREQDIEHLAGLMEKIDIAML